MNEPLVDLANCNAFQEDGDKGKTDWLIRKNKSGDTLFVLPKHLKDNDIFTILEFARKYELIAFNAGIDFAKKQKHNSYERLISDLSSENERLANKLVQLIGEE